MKIAATIARYLLALMFLVFGLNGFLHFLPQPPMTGAAGEFLGLISATHYAIPVFFIQVLCGVLFLIGRYLPLALTLIAPVIVNILMFHITMNPGGIGPALLATVLWFVVAYRERSAFAGILRS